jgi:hypothetical protein
MNILIWIAQGLLAAAMFMSGSMMLMRSRAQLSERMGWVEDFSQSFIRTIAALKVLGALGLILPMLLGILPWLTPVAAIGLAIIMGGAVATHARREDEGRFVFGTGIFTLLAAFIAIGRLWIVPA